MNQGQIERFDVEFNKWDNNFSSKYKIVNLWDIAEFQYWLWESAQENWDLIYIRITDIDEFWLLKKDDLKFVTEQVNFWNSILQKWDILVARTGATYWKTLYFDEDFRATFWGFLIRIKLDTSIILPKYYYYFTHTSLYWNNAKQLVWWWWQPQFNANAVKQLQIPLPPLEIQNQIVEKMDFALSEKKRQEKEAKELLESIDDFVLSELWIEYKEVEEKKVFWLNLSELWANKRLDPSFYKNNKCNFSWKYENIIIWNLIDLFNWYAFKSNDYITKSNTLNFRMSNIRPWWWIDLEYSEKFLPDNYAEKYKNYLLKDWDVVIAMTDMAWEPKILAIPTTIKTGWRKLLLNQRVWKIIFKDLSKLKPKYLHYILLCNFIRESIKWKWSKSVQINLSKEDILNIEIPLPPLEIQEKIALEVKSRIEKAKVLESEAREVYERAKRDVEEMILG